MRMYSFKQQLRFSAVGMRTSHHFVYAVLCALLTGSNGFNMKPYCTPKQTCYPSRERFDTLDASISGRLIFKGDHEYTEQSEMYNTYKSRKPNVIAMMTSETDIRTALLFARKYNLRMAVRSSGHSYAGRSTAADAFVINLSEMKNYTIHLTDSRHSDGVLITQTGITWAELHTALDNVGRVAVGAACRSVTPGGYTLGGGHGAGSITHGYAVDNLLESRVVLADGRFATCTERQTIIEDLDGKTEILNDGDLFWALKGGGGGTFAVVVRHVFKIHEAPESLVLFQGSFHLKSDAFPGGDLKTAVYDAFYSVYPSLKSAWGGSWYIDNSRQEQTPTSTEPYSYRGKLKMNFIKFAPWDGTEEALFSQLLALAITYNMTARLSNYTSFAEFAIPYGKALADGENIYMIGIWLPPQNTGTPLWVWLDRELFGRHEKLACIGINLGGVTMSATTDTPMHPGFRRAVTFLMCKIFLQEQNDEARVRLGERLGRSLKTLGDGQYFNEPTMDNPTWKDDFWGPTNYQRLLGIKYRYDPTNLLTCHHCVASDVTPCNDGVGVPAGTSDSQRIETSLLYLLAVFSIARLFIH